MDAKEKVHITYIFVILIAIIVLVLTGWLTGITDVADKMQFGLALSSILLAVFTIIFAMLSHAALPHTLTELRGITKKVTKATTDLQSQLKAIPTRLDTMEEKFEQQSAMVTEALAKTGTAETPTPELNIEPAITVLLDRMSLNGGFGLYAASLALEHERSLSVPSVSKEIDMDGGYMHGFLGASSMLGVIRWAGGPLGEVTYVHPLIIENIKKQLSTRIKEVFGDMKDKRNEYASKVRTLENYFTFPQEDDTDETTEDHDE